MTSLEKSTTVCEEWLKFSMTLSEIYCFTPHGCIFQGEHCDMWYYSELSTTLPLTRNWLIHIKLLKCVVCTKSGTITRNWAWLIKARVLKKTAHTVIKLITESSLKEHIIESDSRLVSKSNVWYTLNYHDQTLVRDQFDELSAIYTSISWVCFPILSHNKDFIAISS